MNSGDFVQVTATTGLSHAGTTVVLNRVHTYRVTAEDNAGNKSHAEVTLTDDIAPTISFFQVYPNLNNTGKPTIRWAVSDVGSGATFLQLKRNGTEVYTAFPSASPWNAGTWTESATLSEGIHQYVLTVKDTSNNENSKSLEVTVDMTPPTSPMNVGAVVNGSAVTISWGTVQDSSGIASYLIGRTKDGDTLHYWSSATASTNTLTQTLGPGTYIVTVHGGVPSPPRYEGTKKSCTRSRGTESGKPQIPQITQICAD